MTGATSGAGTASSSESHVLTPLWPNLGVDVIEASLIKLPHGIKVTVII
jgi:hypothetical protein